MTPITDDLGHPLTRTGPVNRIVSLVPSLTETVASVRPDILVGATDWCTRPAGLDVTRVRGTKNPDRAAVVALAPDLVLANKEENRRVDVERLRAAGVPVWVTDIESVEGALRSLRRLFTDALRWPVPAWLAAADRAWAGPPPAGPARVVVPVWRDPWMVVGARTFTGDLVGRLGLVNAYAGHAERYPHVTPAEIRAAGPDLIVLPDEPYVFGPEDGPEAFPERPCALVEGRLLTWYGPSLATARDDLLAQLPAEVRHDRWTAGARPALG